MKALSGYAEWFWLIAKHSNIGDGWKDVENRKWSLLRYIKPQELPLRIYLHASKTKTPRNEMNFIRQNLSPENLAEFDAVNWDEYRGKIIGNTTITGQSKCVDIPMFGGKPMRRVLKLLGECRDDSKWLFGTYGFWCENGVLYKHPIPYKGQLGFFNINLPTIPESTHE